MNNTFLESWDIFRTIFTQYLEWFFEYIFFLNIEYEELL